MFGLLLPLYTQSVRDQSGVQWWPVRRRVRMLGNLELAHHIHVEAPWDQCWILDSVLLGARGSTTSRFIFRALTLNEGGFSEGVTITANQDAGPLDMRMFYLRPANTLFVAPGNRLAVRTDWDVGATGNESTLELSGIGFPRGNIAQ